MTEKKPFIMPKPLRGSSVIWYPHGLRGDVSEVAFVLKLFAGSIVIQLASGLVKEAVRHVDDPRLQDNEHQRENGAWDYTDDHRTLVDLQSRLAELESRVAKHEQCHEEAPKQKGAKPSTI